MNKPKRIKDKLLLQSYRGEPCEVCGSCTGTVAHHIKSVGAGGDDTPSNLMCLCPQHHHEIHLIGKETFKKKYS